MEMDWTRVLSTTRARTSSAATAATAAVSSTTRQVGRRRGARCVSQSRFSSWSAAESRSALPGRGRLLDVLGAGLDLGAGVVAQGAPVAARQPPGFARVAEGLAAGTVEPGLGRHSLLHLEDRQEGLLGDLHRPDLLHALLALLLLLEELALAGDVATVALGEDVLAEGLDRLAGDDLGADGRLDGHLVHLLRDDLA